MMEIDEEVAARRLYARRVAETLAMGSATLRSRLPEVPSRGLVLGVVVGMLATVFVGVAGVLVAALSG